MTGRPRLFDEDQVLDRAIELFWRDGFTATSMQSLLDHMGISRQSLYNVFGDKRGLFLAALDRYMEQQGSRLFGSLESPGSGYSTIVDFFAQMGRSVAKSCGARRACLIGKTCMELASNDADVRSRVEAHFARTTRAFEAALNNAMRRGEIQPVNAAAVANHLTATLNGLAIMFKAGADPSDIESAANVALSVLRPTTSTQN